MMQNRWYILGLIHTEPFGHLSHMPFLLAVACWQKKYLMLVNASILTAIAYKCLEEQGILHMQHAITSSTQKSTRDKKYSKDNICQGCSTDAALFRLGI